MCMCICDEVKSMNKKDNGNTHIHQWKTEKKLNKQKGTRDLFCYLGIFFCISPVCGGIENESGKCDAGIAKRTMCVCVSVSVCGRIYFGFTKLEEK